MNRNNKKQFKNRVTYCKDLHLKSRLHFDIRQKGGVSF